MRKYVGRYSSRSYSFYTSWGLDNFLGDLRIIGIPFSCLVLLDCAFFESAGHREQILWCSSYRWVARFVMLLAYVCFPANYIICSLMEERISVFIFLEPFTMNAK